MLCVEKAFYWFFSATHLFDNWLQFLRIRLHHPGSSVLSALPYPVWSSLKNTVFSPAHHTPPASVLAIFSFICQTRIFFVSYNWREISVLILAEFFIDFSGWHCGLLSSLQTSKISVLQRRDQLHCNQNRITES